MQYITVNCKSNDDIFTDIFFVHIFVVILFFSGMFFTGNFFFGTLFFRTPYCVYTLYDNKYHPVGRHSVSKLIVLILSQTNTSCTKPNKSKIFLKGHENVGQSSFMGPYKSYAIKTTHGNTLSVL